MYTAQILSENIKYHVKKRNTLIGTMLSECKLRPNTISRISDDKGMPAFNLAKIADYLECSTDYLLGRTDCSSITEIDTSFFRKLISDKGLNAIKPQLKKKMEEYGFEKLQLELSISAHDIDVFLNSDAPYGIKCTDVFDKLLKTLGTNLYDLFIASENEE